MFNIRLFIVALLIVSFGCMSGTKLPIPAANLTYSNTEVLNIKPELQKLKDNSVAITQVAKTAKDNSVKLRQEKKEIANLATYLSLDANIDQIGKLGTELGCNVANLDIKKVEIDNYVKTAIPEMTDIQKKNIELQKKVEELETSIKDESSAKCRTLFGWMVAVGAIAVAVGIFALIQGAGRIGSGIALAGLISAGTGLAFRMWAVYIAWGVLVAIIIALIIIVINKTKVISEVVEGVERLKGSLPDDIRNKAKELFAAVQSNDTVAEVTAARKEIIADAIANTVNQPVSLDKLSTGAM